MNKNKRKRNMRARKQSMKVTKKRIKKIDNETSNEKAIPLDYFKMQRKQREKKSLTLHAPIYLALYAILIKSGYYSFGSDDRNIYFSNYFESILKQCEEENDISIDHFVDKTFNELDDKNKEYLNKVSDYVVEHRNDLLDELAKSNKEITENKNVFEFVKNSIKTILDRMIDENNKPLSMIKLLVACNQIIEKSKIAQKIN